MQKVELEGYLYITENMYDQYYVSEICLDTDITNTFYQNLSYSSASKASSPTLLAEIIEKKLDIKPVGSDLEYIGNDPFYTFIPDYKKVRITIEVLPNE